VEFVTNVYYIDESVAINKSMNESSTVSNENILCIITYLNIEKKLGFIFKFPKLDKRN